MDLVKLFWANPVFGSPFHVWEEKLRRLKRALKAWAKTLKSPSTYRLIAQRNLENHQISQEEQPMDLTNLEKEANLHCIFQVRIPLHHTKYHIFSQVAIHNNTHALLEMHAHTLKMCKHSKSACTLL